MAINDQANVDRVWEIVGKARVCMMVTQFSDSLRVRPMEALPDRDENVIYFLADGRGLRKDLVEDCPEVYLTFVYPNENVYLALTGEAFVINDLDCARPDFQFAKARLFGIKANLGESQKVTIEL